MNKRYTDEQTIAFLKQAEAGTPIKELCRKHGFSDVSLYLGRRRFCGLTRAESAGSLHYQARQARLNM